jgi:formylglycine-generating enzyme required for sulfatase activity
MERTPGAIAIVLVHLLVAVSPGLSQESPIISSSYFEGPWEAEPNNTPQQANGPLRSYRTYYGYPDDEKDYFSIDLYKGGQIIVDLTNHTGQHVQLQLFYQSTDNRVAVDLEPPYHLEHLGAAGTYYIYINTGAGHNSSDAYTLRVAFPMIHRGFLPIVREPPNRPPNQPSNPAPADGAMDQSVDVKLSWSGGDPDGDPVTYDVYLEAGDDSPDTLACDDVASASCDPGGLSEGEHYYWQVVARDSRGATTPGPVWGFRTEWSPPSDMVSVPAGEFTMGSNDGDSDEQPVHTVHLDAYAIDKYEVTNAQYAGLLNARGNQQEGGDTWLDADDPDMRIHQVGGVWQADAGYGDHPAVEVTWYGALAYCTWAGKRLPTEAEWEKAARGTDGRTYPWGDQLPDCSRANSRCVGDTSRVGSYPSGASPYGVLDMAGNVWEWVNDWHSSGYYSVSPYRNPPGPTSGSYKVWHGGSWGSDAYYLRAAARFCKYPDYGNLDLGFRCASSPGE